MLEHENICLTVNNSSRQAASAHETGKILSWNTLKRLYNAVPLGLTPCRTEREAQLYSVAVLAAASAIFPPFIAVAAYVYLLKKKGGEQ